MTLDRDTYEAWLLDRLEGRLSVVQETLLDAFLAANPDLPIGLDSLPAVDGEGVEFPLKDLLRKAYPPTGAPDAARLDDFLVARLEKDLGPGQNSRLERYLYEHPEAGRQAALMALAKLPADAVPFTEKETLERHFPPKGMPDTHRLTDFLIAAIEGDLSADQHRALDLFVAEDAHARREQMLVAATRTVPAPVVFTGKEQLKKRNVRVVVLWSRLAAAASIALLLGMGWWVLRENPEQRQDVASIEKPISKQTATEDPEVHHTGVTNAAGTGTAEATTGKTPVAIPNGASSTQPGKDPGTKKPTPLPRPLPNVVQPTAPALAQLPVAPSAIPSRKPELQKVPNVPQASSPELAQKPESPKPGTPATATAIPAENEVLAFADTRGTSQSLGTFVANTVRGEVLETPQRKALLDGSDAMALANKAVGALTGGQGGVKVENSGGSERFQLRLGRNLSISASRGR
ncbi:MAG: hypothetical protein ACOH13_05185 [Flavobacteriales bacterium]